MITTVPISIAALSASITRTHNRACQWATASLGDVMCVASTCHELTEAMASQLDAELAKSAQRVITHMNNDHEPSLVAWARFYAKLDAKAARMRAKAAHMSAKAVHIITKAPTLYAKAAHMRAKAPTLCAQVTDHLRQGRAHEGQGRAHERQDRAYDR